MYVCIYGIQHPKGVLLLNWPGRPAWRIRSPALFWWWRHPGGSAGLWLCKATGGRSWAKNWNANQPPRESYMWYYYYCYCDVLLLRTPIAMLLLCSLHECYSYVLLCCTATLICHTSSIAIAMLLLCHCYAIAMLLLWCCYAIVMLLLLLCYLRILSWNCP